MADEDIEEPKKKSGLLKILIFVFAGILLIAVGLAGGYLIFGNTQPDPSEEIDAIIEKTKEEAEADKQAALERPRMQQKKSSQGKTRG